jgi:hypothetical protein
LEQLRSEPQPRWEVNYRQVTVKMSDGLVYTGRVNIREFPRVSDFFRNSEDRFVVVISEQDEAKKVMLLNKNFIVWAEAKD